MPKITKGNVAAARARRDILLRDGKPVPRLIHDLASLDVDRLDVQKNLQPKPAPTEDAPSDAVKKRKTVGVRFGSRKTIPLAGDLRGRDEIKASHAAPSPPEARRLVSTFADVGPMTAIMDIVDKAHLRDRGAATRRNAASPSGEPE